MTKPSPQFLDFSCRDLTEEDFLGEQSAFIVYGFTIYHEENFLALAYIHDQIPKVNEFLTNSTLYGGEFISRFNRDRRDILDGEYTCAHTEKSIMWEFIGMAAYFLYFTDSEGWRHDIRMHKDQFFPKGKEPNYEFLRYMVKVYFLKQYAKHNVLDQRTLEFLETYFPYKEGIFNDEQLLYELTYKMANFFPEPEDKLVVLPDKFKSIDQMRADGQINADHDAPEAVEKAIVIRKFMYDYYTRALKDYDAEKVNTLHMNTLSEFLGDLKKEMT